MKCLQILHMAAWPCVVIACVLLIAGCQDGSGPGLVTSPEGKPSYEGEAPPAPPPNPEILYVQGTRTGNKVCKMNADGSNKVTVVTRPNWMSGAVWSPDASAVAFAHSGPNNAGGLETVRADGSGATMLMTYSDCINGCRSPEWSPTGSEIAVLGGGTGTGMTGRLWIVPAGGGAPLLLYSAPGHPLIDAAWNSDGTVLYITQVGQSWLERAIYAVDSATGAASLVLDDFGVIGGIDHARGGVQEIVFDTEVDGVLELYTLDVGTPGQTPVYLREGRNATFSPDNSFIAFDNFNLRVYKAPVAGGSAIRLASSATQADWKR